MELSVEELFRIVEEVIEIREDEIERISAFKDQILYEIESLKEMSRKSTDNDRCDDPGSKEGLPF